MDKINKNNWWIYVLALFGAAAIGNVIFSMLKGEFNINMLKPLDGVIVGALVNNKRKKRK